MAAGTQPDLSHLSAEERSIIEGVLQRQEAEQQSEAQITHGLNECWTRATELVSGIAMEQRQAQQQQTDPNPMQFNMVGINASSVILTEWSAEVELEQLECEIEQRQQRAARLAAEEEPDATCQICQRTKFADGIGHKCHYCHLRSCARCGGRTQARVNAKFQNVWACTLCARKQQLLGKTGRWFTDPAAYSAHSPTGQSPQPSLEQQPQILSPEPGTNGIQYLESAHLEQPSCSTHNRQVGTSDFKPLSSGMSALIPSQQQQQQRLQQQQHQQQQQRMHQQQQPSSNQTSMYQGDNNTTQQRNSSFSMDPTGSIEYPPTSSSSNQYNGQASQAYNNSYGGHISGGNQSLAEYTATGGGTNTQTGNQQQIQRPQQQQSQQQLQRQQQQQAQMQRQNQQQQQQQPHLNQQQTPQSQQFQQQLQRQAQPEQQQQLQMQRQQEQSQLQRHGQQQFQQQLPQQQQQQFQLTPQQRQQEQLQQQQRQQQRWYGGGGGSLANNNQQQQQQQPPQYHVSGANQLVGCRIYKQ